jgi:hypothetical protein
VARLALSFRGNEPSRAKGGTGATHAICSGVRKKVKYALTLSEIERRLLAGHYERQMQEIIEGCEDKDDRLSCSCAYA